VIQKDDGVHELLCVIAVFNEMSLLRCRYWIHWK